MEICRLSTNVEKLNPMDNVLAMVGSFAPVHYGHIDVMESAVRAMEVSEEAVAASVFAPNSDSYVLSVKLKGKDPRWDFSHRIEQFMGVHIDVTTPVFVDDLSGAVPPERTITESVVHTLSKVLGTVANRVVLVVGSDQIRSMEPHLETNRAVCVIRPGSEQIVVDLLEEKWFRDAVHDRRYVLATRKFLKQNITSTDIRRQMPVTLSEAG